jgi:hypothetical protein
LSLEHDDEPLYPLCPPLPLYPLYPPLPLYPRDLQRTARYPRALPNDPNDPNDPDDPDDPDDPRG